MASRDVDAMVGGADIAGLAQLDHLRELGLSAAVFEGGDGVWAAPGSTTSTREP